MSVPKLRFKEFENDWINTKVKDLGEFSSGGTPSKDIHDYWNGNIPWISSSDLNEESIFDIRINRFISEDAIKNSATKKIPKNSILLVSRVGVGKVALTNQELCTSQDFTALTPKKDYALFIAYLMKNITPRLLDLNQGTSIKGFVREDLISLPISLPSKAEQTKIASFLSNVDEKISQLTQKHELLSQYKQGMMQKLFSQQIRFKADDGSEFGEWEEIQLRDVAERVTRKNKEDNQNALTISAQMGLVNQQDYFSKQIASRDLSKYYLLHKGEFAYNKSYSAGYPMGAIKRLKLYEKGVVSTLYICFALNDQLNANFFEQYVESGALVPELEKIAQEGARNHGLLNISLQEFFEVVILKPCLEEQTKIANFLSSIDQKIEVVAQQIEQAKTWKKGLLQQMFV
ncbi:restriction endonuclease subunit S [Acinetobacter sp. A3]|uniref:restriction endonuclease subunit S n=1 Tax=Acinetobacter sp. A3 TaxID=2725492 RepID=UPI0014455790|nr:restriction endonuclease subunit S [Acinetobacter sp. A3]